jgi:uncharacterized damage-inducible protein DinB
MTNAEATTILNFLMPTIEKEYATTRTVIAAVPDGKGDYKPDPKCMSAMELAWHIASTEQYFMEGAVSGEFGAGEGKLPTEIKTAADILAWYDKETAKNLAKVKAMTGEQLTRIINFHDFFIVPAIVYIQLMVNHSIHHRGQLSAYLRPMGAKVPSIYGPSADVPIEMPAKA